LRRKMIGVFLVSLLLAWSVFAQGDMEITFEDYDDQGIFNHFSGDWNKWENFPGTFEWSFDTTNCEPGHGACLRVDYAVPQGNYGGIWNSLLGKVDFDNQYLDFMDLYGDLKNSSGNPTNVEDVRITGFSFWAKGNGTGDFDHNVNVELKDMEDRVASKAFIIPNMSDWTKYTFPVSEMGNVDLTHMKQVVFVLSDFQNDYRTNYLFLDDLSFNTSEDGYDASTWSDDQFLDLVAHRAFKYFLTFTDDLGFALDRSTFSDLVSVGAIGFQLTAYCIGYKRGWADWLESRIENILRNLASLSMGREPGTVHGGYKGFFYHFLDANTGKRKNTNVELSLYDTMLLMQGVSTAKACFPENQNIQSLAQSLYEAVEWDWMVDPTPGEHQYQFYLGWKPESGFEGHADGYTDEALLVDVLALGSPTHPTTMATYNARDRFMRAYPATSTDEIAAAWTGSLFNYSFANGWLDLQRRGTDQYNTQPLNIWENNRRAILANRQFCIDHQDDVTGDGDDQYTTYGPLSWGLTAADNLATPSSGLLSEYYAFGTLPTEQNIRFGADAPHLGTIAVYGAGSAITYAPGEAIAAVRNYYTSTTLWSPLFGFGDAFSTDPHYFEIDPMNFEPVLNDDGNLKIHPATWLNGPWVNHMMMGIDEGPMLLAIENYRSGLIWNLTNANPNIQAGLDAVFGPLPNPHIKANGSDGPVTITSEEVLSITGSLEAENRADEDADWWLAVHATSGPFSGWFYYDIIGGCWCWKPGLSVTHQGPLFDLAPFEILQISGLPTGTYIFVFGFDTNMNGTIDGPLYYDFVTVNVTQAAPPEITLEGEEGSGPGREMMRSNASGSQTALLYSGESQSFQFDLPAEATYQVMVRYSNDNYGSPETVRISVDGNLAGQFQALDTGDFGYGWNVFEESQAGTITLETGQHSLAVTVMGGDGYGVEIDKITLVRN
jgi:hypothetical protein